MKRKIVCVIPARGGSKRIKNKNIIKSIVVSTSSYINSVLEKNSMRKKASENPYMEIITRLVAINRLKKS